MVKYKLEISLLLSAIGLYVLSAFCYSYESQWMGNLPVINRPYRNYAFPLVGLASVFLVIAAIFVFKKKITLTQHRGF